MSDWNPSLYLHFAAERSRPAVELLARVPLENIEYIADLGCGPGNSTALLHYPDRGREPLAGVHAYYDILSEAGCEVDIWRTTYYHQMPSHQAIIDWVTATGLRPWLQDLTESEQQHFLTRYHQMLEEQYPLQENGQILLAFPRLFIVARRTE